MNAADCRCSVTHTCYTTYLNALHTLKMIIYSAMDEDVQLRELRIKEREKLVGCTPIFRMT